MELNRSQPSGYVEPLYSVLLTCYIINYNSHGRVTDVGGDQRAKPFLWEFEGLVEFIIDW